MQEELDSVLRKLKIEKFDEIPPEVWKTREFDNILLQHSNAVYNQNTVDRWTKGCILPFLTSTVAKIYNALQHNHIEPKIEKILKKNQNGFQRNQSMTSQILTIRQILEGAHAKNIEATILFVNFSKVFDSIHSGKMEQILCAYGLPKEAIVAIMMLYKNTKVKARSQMETQTSLT